MCNVTVWAGSYNTDNQQNAASYKHWGSFTKGVEHVHNENVYLRIGRLQNIQFLFLGLDTLLFKLVNKVKRSEEITLKRILIHMQSELVLLH